MPILAHNNKDLASLLAGIFAAIFFVAYSHASASMVNAQKDEEPKKYGAPKGGGRELFFVKSRDGLSYIWEGYKYERRK